MIAKSQTSRARSLRSRSTDAERCLWYRLRNRQLNGWKFRRQVPIDRYIADFACLDAKLIVELDGGQHALNMGEDAARSGVLEACGYQVVRCWNSDVLVRTDDVLEDILSHLEQKK